MPIPRRNAPFLPLDDTVFAVKQRKTVLHVAVIAHIRRLRAAGSFES